MDNSDRLLVPAPCTLPESDRPVQHLAPQAGDVVIVDFDAARTEGDDGEPILGAKRDNMRVDTETADRDFMPGTAAYEVWAF